MDSFVFLLREGCEKKKTENMCGDKLPPIGGQLGEQPTEGNPEVQPGLLPLPEPGGSERLAGELQCEGRRCCETLLLDF